MSLLKRIEQKVSPRVMEFAQDKIKKFIASDRGKQFITDLAQSPETRNAALNFASGFAQNILGPNTEQFFSMVGGPLQAKLLSFMDGSDDLASTHMMAFLGLGEKNPEVFTFLNTSNGQLIVDAISKMGKGAGSQVLDGLAHEGYRVWLENNQPPAHPDKLGISKDMRQQTNEHAQYYICDYCANRSETHTNRCPSCNSSDSLVGFSNVPNTKYQGALQKLHDWQKRSEAKKREFGINTNAIGLEEAGVAVAAIAAGSFASLDPEALMQQLFGGGATNGSTKTDIVRDTLNKQNNGVTVIETDGMRLPESAPQKLFRALQEAAKGNSKILFALDEVEGAVFQTLKMARKSKVLGTAICMSECIVTGQDAEIQGDLIIFGSLKGMNLPTVRGKIYFVHDPEYGVEAELSMRGASAQVIHCTIDRAYLLAKEAGLV